MTVTTRYATRKSVLGIDAMRAKVKRAGRLKGHELELGYTSWPRGFTPVDHWTKVDYLRRLGAADGDKVRSEIRLLENTNRRSRGSWTRTRSYCNITSDSQCSFDRSTARMIMCLVKFGSHPARYAHSAS